MARIRLEGRAEEAGLGCIRRPICRTRSVSIWFRLPPLLEEGFCAHNPINPIYGPINPINSINPTSTLYTLISQTL